jgi:lysophospholipase L1-like esterase
MNAMNEIDFKANKRLFDSVLGTVEDIGLNRRCVWSERSDVEQEIFEQIESEGLARDRVVREGIKNVPLPLLCAYYVAKNLATVFKEHSTTSSLYKDFAHLSRVITENSIKDVNYLSQYIFEFARKKYFSLQLSLNQIHAWLRFFQESFKVTQSLVPATGRKKAPEVTCPNPVQHQVIQILQHISVKYGQRHFPLWKLQNVLVEEGLDLRAKNHWQFAHAGVQCTIVDILRQDLAALVAWYLTDKVLKHHIAHNSQSPLTNSAKRDLKQHLYTLFFEAATEGKLKKGKIMRRCAYALHDLQEMYAFTRQDICRWMFGLSHIVSAYNNLQLAKKTNPAPPHKVRIYLLGDSVSAGYGISDPNNRWVNILVALFASHGIECEIINRSLVGYEASDAAKAVETIKEEVALFKPDVVFGTVMGNDVYAKRGKDYSEAFVLQIQRDLTTIIEACQMQASVQEVLWAGGIPEAFRMPDAFHTGIRAMFTRLKRDKRIETVLLSPQVLQASNTQSDGIHFNDAIQATIAGEAFVALIPIITRVLDRKKALLPSLRPSSAGLLDPSNSRSLWSFAEPLSSSPPMDHRSMPPEMMHGKQEGRFHDIKATF